MSKKRWERKECSGNPECKQGMRSLYLYKLRKVTSEKEKYDTS